MIPSGDEGQFGITPLKRPQFRSDLSQFPNDFVQIIGSAVYGTHSLRID